MEGRGSGTAGADRAAGYLEAEFRRLGLRPAGDGGGFLQRFEVLTGVRLASGATIDVTAPGAASRTFAGGSDFLPFTFSADGDVTGRRRLRGLRDHGAAARLRRLRGPRRPRQGRPRDDRGAARDGSREGRSAPAEHFHYTELRHKVLNAREHGAAAVIVVENPGRGDRLAALRGTTPSWGIVAISARRERRRGVAGAHRARPRDLHAEIDRARAPRVPRGSRRPGPGSVDAPPRPGSDRERRGHPAGHRPALAAEAVVRRRPLRPPRPGQPVLAARRSAATRSTRARTTTPRARPRCSGSPRRSPGPAAPRRSVVFVAFSGEELGLLGSTHYVSQPAVPLDRTVAMVNLDSVGRLRDGRLHVMGVDTGQGLRGLVEQAAPGTSRAARPARRSASARPTTRPS